MGVKAMQHLLTGEELSAVEISKLLTQATLLKRERKAGVLTPVLKSRQLALLFDKPSLRTRFSFTVAMRELGGDVVESIGDTRKAEEPEDQVRVLSGYCHAIMVRTHEDGYLKRMADFSSVPIINGLSNGHHPCQILADLLTIQEVFGSLDGLNLAYIGDGNNILHSLLLIAPMMGISIHYCCPDGRSPNENILMHAQKNVPGKIYSYTTPIAAVAGVQAVYTDVWTSMGFENQIDESEFVNFQVNEELMRLADADAIFMHCLPMVRGKEVSVSLPDAACSVIFQQSENRLHVQKALLIHLL
jgi:ornithine carbamoyltransferase